MPTQPKQGNQDQRQSQEQGGSGSRQDQSQRRNDDDRDPVEKELPPKGHERLPDDDQDRDSEGNKTQRKEKNNPGTERDPAGISPQDDLA